MSLRNDVTTNKVKPFQRSKLQVPDAGRSGSLLAELDGHSHQLGNESAQSIFQGCVFRHPATPKKEGPIGHYKSSETREKPKVK